MENHSDKPLAKQETSKKKHKTKATNKSKKKKEKGGASTLTHDDSNSKHNNNRKREQKRISHQDELRAYAKLRREQQQHLQEDGQVESPSALNNHSNRRSGRIHKSKKRGNNENHRENQHSQISHCALGDEEEVFDYEGGVDNEEDELDLRRIPDIAPGAFAIDEEGEVLRGRGKHNITTVNEIEEGGLYAREKNDRFAPLAPVERAQAGSDGSEGDKDRRRRGKRFIIALSVVALVVVSIAVAVPVALLTSNNKKNENELPTTRASPTLSPTQSPTAAQVTVIPAEWQPVGQVMHGKATADYFGHSVSLSRDGSVMAIGAYQWSSSSSTPGYVVVQRYNPSIQQWEQIGQELIGHAGGDSFGNSVSLNGDGTILAVGADANDSGGTNAGHVRVFEYNSASDRWVQLGSDVLGQKAGDLFGVSVSLSEAGDILAVGAPGDDTENGFDFGSVRLFRYNRGSSSWNQLGQTLIGQAPVDSFGVSVSLNAQGTIVGVGAEENDSGGIDAGQVLVYEYYSTPSRWDLLGSPITGQVLIGSFGRSVSLDDSGLIVAAGAPGSDERVLVYSYDRSTLTWNQHGQTLLTQQDGDSFGWSVSLSGNGNVLAVGSRWHDVNGLVFAGQVRIFQHDSNADEWKQVGDPLNGKAIGDEYGWSVSLSANGSVVGVGARGADVNGLESGSAHAFTVNVN